MSRPSRQGIGLRGGAALALLWLVTALLAAQDAHAFFTTLKYKTEEQGKREVISFMIPPGASRPVLRLTDPETLQLMVPGILALPATELKLDHSKWIKAFRMAETSHGEEMGLMLTFTLKDANINYRDSVGEYDPVDGALYRLELDPPLVPSGSGPAQLQEGRILAGRDGTLLILSYTGKGLLDPVLDLGTRVLRMDWQGATLSPTWRNLAAAGLVDRINVYPFQGKVELEVILHESVANVNFLGDPDAGIFIAAIRPKDGLGRQEEAEKFLAMRRKAVAEKKPQPLHRIGTVTYQHFPDNKVRLNEKEVDELYYLNNAKDAEQDHHYAKARGYVDRLVELFPLTKNREFLDMYKLDLAHRMDWKSGWLLGELSTILVRYPNTGNYPELRLMQLQLLNQSGQFQEASSILWDPNLPRDSHLVWLERGRTAMGLVRSRVEPDDNIRSGETALEKVLESTRNQGPAAAEAQFLLAQFAMERGNNEAAIKLLDEMTPEQRSHIANVPERLMETGDIYYRFRRYHEAVNFYSQVLTSYPTHPSITPWAMLRAAESNRQLGHIHDAIRLFERLKKNYTGSDAVTWGRIFQLQLEKDRDIQDRLDELAKIIQAINLPKEQADAFMASIRALLVETNRHWDVRKSLDQLTALKKDYPKIDASLWEKIPVLQEKMEQNFKDRLTRLDKLIREIALPEALAEAYMTKAEMLGEAGQYKAVLETLNQLLTISSRGNMIDRAKELKRHYLMVGMGKALEDGKPEMAAMLAEYYGEDWREDPAFIPARIHLAEAMMRMGLHENALQVLNGIDSDAARSLKQLAGALVRGSILDVPVRNKERAPGGQVGQTSPDAARVRLDEAGRLVRKQDWEGILVLLDDLPETLFNPSDRVTRWRLLAKAEAGLERFPQAVQHMEDLLFGRPVGDGMDYYWYATILHKWKGDAKALPAFQRVAAEAENKEIKALARIRIGDILQRSGDFKAAREQFSGVDKLAPATPWSKVSSENDAQLGLAMDVKP
ncbi:MAG: tetratricopeptide repeat protein [Magnetococcales bacterium]|nr:tetratricopeptide repeat protein [Magnetococcales bacterium]